MIVQSSLLTLPGCLLTMSQHRRAEALASGEHQTACAIIVELMYLAV